MRHARVDDIIREVTHLAPPRLAEKWDNIGLQVGRYDWPVRKVRVALDPGPEVVTAAADDDVDMLITHHPLIFPTLRSIDFATPEGTAIQAAAVNRLAIYTAHTNLDSARYGLNQMLAGKIGLEKPVALVPMDDADLGEGLGRVGKIPVSTTLGRLAVFLKEKLRLDAVRIVGDQHLSISRVALCTGSGSGLIQAFLDSRAEVFVSGDLRYHDARLIETRGRGAIDIGHFASEHIMVKAFAADLQRCLDEKRINVRVESWEQEQDPFRIF